MQFDIRMHAQKLMEAAGQAFIYRNISISLSPTRGFLLRLYSERLLRKNNIQLVKAWKDICSYGAKAWRSRAKNIQFSLTILM